MWSIGLAIFPTGGFYIATIASPASDFNGERHFWDLRIADIHYGGYGALIGLGLGICLGLWATFRYPMLKEKEARLDEEWDHRTHHELSAHEETSADFGQRAEHEQTLLPDAD